MVQFFLFLLFSMGWLAGLASPESTPLPADKINLALRRTADKLLRASGDSTSRIPAVEQVSDHAWKVYINKPIDYNQLPALLQASMDQYDIRQEYEVAVRSCATDLIDLGYHKLDFQQDSIVPCSGRESPEGCHYIEVTFNGTAPAKPLQAGIPILVFLVAASGAGIWWWMRKRQTPGDITVETEGDWLSFGQSRLHESGQVLECAGEKQSLTYREAKLLHLFASHPGELLGRDHILSEVWGDEGVQVSRSIDVFVSRLRKKLAADPSIAIVAVHGVGYKLDAGVS